MPPTKHIPLGACCVEPFDESGVRDVVGCGAGSPDRPVELGVSAGFALPAASASGDFPVVERRGRQACAHAQRGVVSPPLDSSWPYTLLARTEYRFDSLGERLL